MLTNILAVAAGGAVGSVVRYLVGLTVLAAVGAQFPIGTLGINIVGSFLLGVIVMRFAGEPAALALLGVGLMGGFTTFSSFSVETVRMIEDGAFLHAGLYVGLSVGLSLIAAAGGMMVMRTWL